MHAAHLRAGCGPGQEQSGAGGSVQSGGRTGCRSRRTDCEPYSPATEQPGTAATGAAHAVSENYLGMCILCQVFLAAQAADTSTDDPHVVELGPGLFLEKEARV